MNDQQKRRVSAPYTVTPLTLAANIPREVRGATRFAALLSASVNAETVEIAVGESDSWQPLLLGVALVELENVDRLSIRSSTPQVVRVVTGSAMIYDSRAAAGGGTMLLDITSVGGTGIGQKLMAASVPVAIASDQSNVPVAVQGPVTPYAAAASLVRGQTAAAMTLLADTQVIAAPVAGLKLHITTIVVTNSHATVGTEVAIKDGATELFRVYVPAINGTAGPSTVPITLPVPLRLTDATALNAANLTTGSNTYVFAAGFTGA